MVLKAIIFDFDGTIADTERDGHRVAFNLAFEEFELDWYWHIHQYAKLLKVNGGEERIQHYIDELPPRLIMGLKTTLAQDLYAIKTKHYLNMLAQSDGIPFRPGILRIIKEAKHKGIKLAIATSSTEINVIALLKNRLGTEASSWFDVIATSNQVSNKKPEPDVYKYVLQALELRPEDCIAIEDSEYGLKAAIGAGIKTLITFNDYTSQEDFKGAVAVLPHLGEIEQPIDTLANLKMSKNMVDCELLEYWCCSNP